MKRLINISPVIFIFLSGLAYAEAPVVDATPSGIYQNQPTMPIASPTVSARVQSLEQEVQRLNEKLNSLKQTNEDLSNLVNMQSKQIAALKKQKSYSIVKQPIKQSMVVAAPKKSLQQPLATPVPTSPPSQSSAPQPKMVIVGQTTTTTSSLPKASPSKTIDKSSGNLYEQAYGFVKTQQYSQAIPLLQQYVKDSPTGKDAGNAYYWLGQLQLIAGNSEQAQDAYTNLVNHYPHAAHVPDAMLQLAAIASSAQQWTAAKQWLQKVVAAYPNTAAARLAQVRLQQLAQSGH